MPAILNIPLEILTDLYLNQHLSSRKIAKIFNCAYSTIDRKIRQANLPIKTLAGAHMIYPRKDFSGDLIEKAYLIGFRVGDLRVRKYYRNSETILVDCASTKSAQIELIGMLFSQYGHIWISKPNKRNKFQIQCSLNLSFEFLLRKTPPCWIFRKKPLFLSFLAGFIDAEGSIFISSHINRVNQACLSIGNYDISLLEKIKLYLVKFGIEVPKISFSPRKGLIASHGYAYNNDYWTLRINKKSTLLKLFDLMRPFLKHGDRIRQMEVAINNIELRNKLYGQK